MLFYVLQDGKRMFNKVKYDNEYVKEKYKRLSLNLENNYFYAAATGFFLYRKYKRGRG